MKDVIKRLELAFLEKDYKKTIELWEEYKEDLVKTGKDKSIFLLKYDIAYAYINVDLLENAELLLNELLKKHDNLYSVKYDAIATDLIYVLTELFKKGIKSKIVDYYSLLVTLDRRNMKNLIALAPLNLIENHITIKILSFHKKASYVYYSFAAIYLGLSYFYKPFETNLILYLVIIFGFILIIPFDVFVNEKRSWLIKMCRKFPLTAYLASSKMTEILQRVSNK